MDFPRVSILLATYNGERYLPELLASLARQSHANWRLHVRDDGSRDATQALLAEAAQCDPRIVLVADGAGNLGARGNFAQLLAQVEAEYYMFADQDDVWLPDKIRDSLALLRAQEAAQGSAHPMLVFTDLQVTDQALRVLYPSELRRHGFDRLIGQGVTLRRLLTQNIAAGCTLLFNRPLRDAASPIPPETVMHDWWLALTAVAIGQILFLDQATLLYRQHGDNQMGAASLPERVLQMLRTGARPYRERQSRARLQTLELLRRFQSALPESDRQLCRLFATLDRYPPPLRQVMALRHRLSRWGWARNIAFYALL